MKIKTFRNFLRDATHHIRRNPLMSIASVSSVIAVLILMGVFLIFMLNIQNLADTLESQIEMQAFLDLDITQEKINNIQSQLKINEKIESITFETKEEALENWAQQLGEKGEIMKGLEESNPLQHSFIIKLKDPKDVEELYEFVKDIDGIEEVKYGEEIVDKLLRSTSSIRWITIILTLVLTGVSVFIISNTIKLTVFARRKEISIMKYVGATNWYVRWPFLMEGAFLGIVGALFSALILGYSYYYLTGLAESSALSMFSQSMVPAGTMMTKVSLFFLVAGLVIGSLGSILSIRRFLRV